MFNKILLTITIIVALICLVKISAGGIDIYVHHSGNVEATIKQPDAMSGNKSVFDINMK